MKFPLLSGLISLDYTTLHMISHMHVRFLKAPSIHWSNWERGIHWERKIPEGGRRKPKVSSKIFKTAKRSGLCDA